MKIKELKKMIKDAFIAEETNDQYFYEPMGEANAPINIVTTMDEKTIVGTHQYGVGFKSNEAGKKMGFKDNPTSIPNGTKMSEDDKIEEDLGQSDIESAITGKKLDLAKLQAATEKAMKGDSTDLTMYMARIFEADKVDEAEEEKSLDDMLADLMVEDLNEAEEEEEVKVKVDAEEEVEDEGGEEKSDSIVVDKKIVSLSSLPNDTRKILDALEILRARAAQLKLNGSKESSFQESAQKLIDQVRNTIVFFTRDFVGGNAQSTKEQVGESLEILRMKKIAGLLTEGEYAKALLKEEEKREGIISFGPFENVEWYLRYDGEIFLTVTESDNFRKIEGELEITSDEFTDEQIAFLNDEVDELAKKMSEYLTSIGIKNEIYDNPIGYGQEIDNLVVAFDKSDLSKLK
jgi:hypothetical protein